MRLKASIRTIIFAFVLVFHGASARAAVTDSPEYWIRKLKDPDNVLLTASRIDEFNRHIIASNDQMADLEAMPDKVSGEKLLSWLLKDPVPEAGLAPRYDSRGRLFSNASIEWLKNNMNLGAVAEENPVWRAVIIARADMMAFPSDEPMFMGPSGGSMDTTLYSSLYPSEEAALLHLSSDGEWGFFQTQALRGWVRLDKAAFEPSRPLPLAKDGFLVVTGSSVGVYSAPAFKRPIAELPMGTVVRLKARRMTKGAWVVLFPFRSSSGGLVWKDAYISAKAQVRRGFLPYTKRNIIVQSFRMLGEEYGWGGRDGLRDCSMFVKDVFAAFGIRLPRNSRAQSLSGIVKAGAGKAEGQDMLGAVLGAEAGLTLLGLDGHIMIYLGKSRGVPFAINQIAGYWGRRGYMRLNRAAVVGLNAGAGAPRGALLERIRAVTEVLLPAYGKDSL